MPFGHDTISGLCVPPSLLASCFQYLKGVSAACVNYLNPSSFQPPSPGTFGTMAKGELRGPDLINWDMGVFKNIAVHESWRLQFRAEFFNTFNRADFSNPQSTLGGAGFGAILSAGSPRIGQLALKLFF